MTLLALILAGCASGPMTFSDGEQARQDGEFDQAAEIWQQLAEEGDEDARLALHRLYEATRVGFDSDEAAREDLQNFANLRNNPEAMHLLAMQLHEERSFERALSYLERAERLNHNPSREFLSRNRDVLNRKVRAQRGDMHQQLGLGEDHFFGQNQAPQDYEESAIWYRKAASEGHVRAQVMLGYQYLQGLGVVQDDFQAFEWYREAALQGNAGAMGTLGYLYGEGRGTSRDLILAFAWSTLAKERGDSSAEQNQIVYLEQLNNEQRLQSHNEIRRLESLIR